MADGGAFALGLELALAGAFLATLAWALHLRATVAQDMEDITFLYEQLEQANGAMDELSDALGQARVRELRGTAGPERDVLELTVNRPDVV